MNKKSILATILVIVGLILAVILVFVIVGKNQKPRTTTRTTTKDNTTTKEVITSYTITYVLDGGTNGDNIKKYDKNTNFTLLPASKEGFEFKGWYLEDTYTTKVTVIDSNLTGNITLYAKFEEIIISYDYNIIYHLDGGINNANNPSGFNEDETFILKDPAKLGYDFEGWYLDEGCTAQVTEININTDYELYAKFSIHYYSLNYENIDGLTNTNPSTYSILDDNIILADVEKYNYVFVGWYTSPTFEADTKIEVIDVETVKDYTLYARLVEKDAPIVHISANSQKYSGSEIDLVTASVEHGTIYYSLDNIDYSTDIPKGKNAKTYYVYYKVIGEEGYKNLDIQTLEVIISKSTYDMSGVHFDGSTITYDGEEHSITITGDLPDGVSVAYTGEAGITVGTYTFTASFTGDSENYELIADMNASLEITKATYDMSGVHFDDSPITYDGNEHSIEITGTLPNGVTVSYDGAGTNVDEYTITASFSGDSENYELISDMTATLTITNASMTDFSITAYEGAFDNAEHNIASTYSATTVDSSEITWLFSSNGTDYVASINVKNVSDSGTYYYKVSAANHETITGTITVTISKATYDMSGVSFNDSTVTYDGNEHSIEISGTKPYGVSVNYDGNNQIIPYVYTITATFTGDFDNYNEIEPMTATLTINKADLTDVVVHGLNINYDGEEHNIVADKTATSVNSQTITWLFSSDETNWVSEILVSEVSDSGTYYFKASAPNHNDYTGNFDVVISNKIATTIEITNIEDLNKAYDGSEIVTPDIDTNSNGTITITYSSDGSTFTTDKPVSAGNYTIKVETSETASYAKGSIQRTFTISKKTLTITDIVVNNKVYEGTNSATISNYGSLVGIVNSDEVSLDTTNITAAFDDVNVGNDVLVNITNIKLLGSDKENYTISSTSTSSANITNATITNISITAYEYVFDNAEHNIASTYSATTVDSSEITWLFSSNGTDYVASINVKNVSDSGTYYYKASAANHETITGTITVTISKATYNMSGVHFENASFDYDGNVHSIEVTGTLPDGVTVSSYDGNNQINPDTYTVTAYFTGDYDNYNEITPMTATLTIGNATPVVDTTVSVVYDQSLGGNFFNTSKDVSTITYNGSFKVGETNVVGTIAYTDAKTALVIGSTTYAWTFTPTDTTKYNTVTGTCEITVYATVKYYNNETLIKTNYVEYGELATNETAPAVTGYTHSGWSLTNGSSIAFDFDIETITSNTNLYAIYTLTNYTITYNLDGGEIVNPIETYTILTETFTLQSPYQEDKNFVGWTGEGITTPTLTVQIAKGSTGNKTYTANWVDAEVVAYYLNNTSKTFTSIEKALSSASSGDIVCVIPPTGKNYNSSTNNVSSTEKVTYYIRKNCEIKAGVTLVLPTDSTTISGVTTSNTLTTYINSMRNDEPARNKGGNYNAYATTDARYLRVTVEIASGVTLTNNGTLVISGYLSGGISNGGVIGHTAHSYARIVLDQNAKIVQNSSSATTYCFGYISEKSLNNGSSVSFANGKLYIPFIIADYKGFSFSWAMTDGAIDTQGCSPFNQFEFRNIDALAVYNYNASVYGIINIYVSYPSQSVNEMFNKELNILGNTTSFVFQLTDSTYSRLEYKFNPQTTISDINVYGGLKLNNLTISLSKSIVSINLSTTNGYFPISWRQNIKLLKGEGQTSAIFNATSQMIKLLPGSSMEVCAGCTLNGKNIIVYTAFGDSSTFNGYSSAYGSTNPYPIKDGAILIINDGATLSCTKLAGNVYADNATITYTTDNISSYEAWSIGGSGSISPAWTIKDYLMINEKYQKAPISYLTTKQKMYLGINTFKNYNSYLPAYNIVDTTTNTKYSVSQYQKVIFFDSMTSYSVELISNIYKVFNKTTYYKKNNVITYNANNKYVFAINSVESISSNASGINQFDVQSLSINCTTPTVQGNIPLYPDSTVSLEAVITIASKAYDKSVKWSSSNTSIATVDANGNVTGVALGQVVITATCDGKTATITLNVIEEVQYDDIDYIYITDDQGGSSLVVKGTNNDGNPGKDYNGGNYSNGTNVTLSLNVNPNTAPYASITWTFKASGAGRQYLNDSTLATETVENVTSVVVHMVSGTGGSDDTCWMYCTVVDLKGNQFKATFTMSHKADSICFTEDTLITLSDGSQKMVKDLLKTDLIMAFNHEQGIYEATQIAGIYNHGYSTREVTNLVFSNGYTQRFIYLHGLFDLDLNKYVSITQTNYNDYIGHRFVVYNDTNTNYSSHYVTLESAYVSTEYVGSYNIVTVKNINAVINGMLSIDTATDGIYNYFEYGDNLKYDEEKMQHDIETYGLSSYDEWEEFAPYEMYYVFNGQYLSVAIGKGLVTKEYIIQHILWTLQMIASGELI